MAAAIITEETAQAVFTLAARSANWTATNVGVIGVVEHGGETWTVCLPPQGRNENYEPVPVQAVITGRYGYGGTEHLNVKATWAQTGRIVEAAMPALRA
jgi:hypothetical protein